MSDKKNLRDIAAPVWVKNRIDWESRLLHVEQKVEYLAAALMDLMHKSDPDRGV